MWSKRIEEIVGQVVLGDGITCIIVPRQHMYLWADAFPSAPFWRRTVLWFAARPAVTIALGIVECLLGVIMIARASRHASVLDH
jgi:hypothetical protein